MVVGSLTRYIDEVRDGNLRDRTEEVEFDSFLPGSVVEIEGANILNLRRRHAERRTFEQDPGAREWYIIRDRSDRISKARKTHSIWRKPGERNSSSHCRACSWDDDSTCENSKGQQRSKNTVVFL